MMSTTLDQPAARAEVRLCRIAEIPLGLGRAFEVNGIELAVFRSRADTVHVMENRCPHRGGPLADGMLAGDRAVCPFHSFRFHLETGECDQSVACGVAVLPARTDQGWVLLSLVDCRSDSAIGCPRAP